MRFTCEKAQLVTGLNIASRTVAQKSGLSVIEGILCKAGNCLSMTGYNMETAITYDVEADIADPGDCVLPAKLRLSGGGGEAGADGHLRPRRAPLRAPCPRKRRNDPNRNGALKLRPGCR